MLSYRKEIEGSSGAERLDNRMRQTGAQSTDGGGVAMNHHLAPTASGPGLTVTRIGKVGDEIIMKYFNFVLLISC